MFKIFLGLCPRVIARDGTGTYLAIYVTHVVADFFLMNSYLNSEPHQYRVKCC